MATPRNVNGVVQDIANTFLCKDAAASPVTSPMTVSGDLTVHATAIWLVCTALTAAGAAVVKGTGGTDVLPVGVPVRLPVAGLGTTEFGSLVAITVGGGGSVSFRFECMTPTGA